MKTELINNGTWLCTGSFGGRRFIAEGRSRADAMAEGFLAINDIVKGLAGFDLPPMLREQAQ